jgi:ABC-2 type transport system permease protein
MTPRRVGVIVAHELRIMRRDPMPIMVLIAFPIITMAFLKPAFRPALVHAGHAQANGAEHVVPGQAVVGAFFLVSMITLSFFAEHTWATWDRLRASAATSIEIVAGKAVPRIAIGITQLVVLLLAGVVVFDLRVRGDALAIGPLVVAFATCLVMLGVGVTAVCRTAQQANAIALAGMVLFGAIGGALVPFSVLPDWARAIAPATPTYWAMRGLESVILDGTGFGGVALPVGVLLAMSALFAGLAARALRFDEAKIGFA